jgi:hypothetical protein
VMIYLDVNSRRPRTERKSIWNHIGLQWHESMFW